MGIHTHPHRPHPDINKSYCTLECSSMKHVLLVSIYEQDNIYHTKKSHILQQCESILCLRYKKWDNAGICTHVLKNH